MQNPRIRFESLAEKLLRGGIAPKHVRRYIAELKDHADDLLRAGVSETDAWTQLGSEDHLAQEMLKRDDLKSLAARHPVAYFGFGPALTLLMGFAGVILLMIAVISVTKSYLGIESSASIPPEIFQTLISYKGAFEGLAWFVKYAMPVIAAGWFVFRALQQRAPLRWVGFGVGLIALIGGASDMSFGWPSAPGIPGELRFGFGLFPPFPALDNSLFRALTNFALLAPALVWLRYLRAHPLH
jgi:hypothetical protein